MKFILRRIKRCIIKGRVCWTDKARAEAWLDGLDEEEVHGAILGAVKISKVLRSRAVRYGGGRQYLYVIRSRSQRGTMVYTKGRISLQTTGGHIYVLISAKRDLG